MALPIKIAVPNAAKNHRVSAFSEKLLPKPPNTVSEKGFTVAEHGVFCFDGGHSPGSEQPNIRPAAAQASRGAVTWVERRMIGES